MTSKRRMGSNNTTHRPEKNGSSRIAGVGRFDLQERVLGVAVAEGLPLDQANLVVNDF